MSSLNRLDSTVRDAFGQKAQARILEGLIWFADKPATPHTCEFCTGSHHPASCPLTIPDKVLQLFQQQRCIVCLDKVMASNHQLPCTQRGCARCGGAHNSLLCILGDTYVGPSCAPLRALHTQLLSGSDILMNQIPFALQDAVVNHERFAKSVPNLLHSRSPYEPTVSVRETTNRIRHSKRPASPIAKRRRLSPAESVSSTVTVKASPKLTHKKAKRRCKKIHHKATSKPNTRPTSPLVRPVTPDMNRPVTPEVEIRQCLIDDDPLEDNAFWAAAAEREKSPPADDDFELQLDYEYHAEDEFGN